jgi:hypothetical protein
MSDTYALLKKISMTELSGISLRLLRPSARICAPAQLQIERGCGGKMVICEMWIVSEVTLGRQLESRL